METLRQWLFVLACIPSFGGPMITWALAPEPTKAVDHIKGAGRLLMMGGAGFGAISVIFRDSVPSWSCLSLAMGLAIHITLNAREQHIKALREQGIYNVWQYLHQRMPVIWHAIVARLLHKRKESRHA